MVILGRQRIFILFPYLYCLSSCQTLCPEHSQSLRRAPSAARFVESLQHAQREMGMLLLRTLELRSPVHLHATAAPGAARRAGVPRADTLPASCPALHAGLRPIARPAVWPCGPHAKLEPTFPALGTFPSPW